jgi:hypothetical protein
MPRAGFEPAIPMFERPKTVLALDHMVLRPAEGEIRARQISSRTGDHIQEKSLYKNNSDFVTVKDTTNCEQSERAFILVLQNG